MRLNARWFSANRLQDAHQHGTPGARNGRETKGVEEDVSIQPLYVSGARAADAAAAAPELSDRPPQPAWRFSPPTAETREAVWRHAGPRRDAETLEALLHDAYPLARLIARAALERRESRGPHRRSDHPLQDPHLDGVHVVVEGDESVHTERWP